jgi:hypothetical protein
MSSEVTAMAKQGETGLRRSARFGKRNPINKHEQRGYNGRENKVKYQYHQFPQTVLEAKQ